MTIIPDVLRSLRVYCILTAIMERKTGALMQCCWGPH